MAAVATLSVSEGYLKHPRVSVEVENYRPFYIRLGEVKTPGQYPYIADECAECYRAGRRLHPVLAEDLRRKNCRNGSNTEVKAPADQTTKIGPVDIVVVMERFSKGRSTAWQYTGDLTVNLLLVSFQKAR